MLAQIANALALGSLFLISVSSSDKSSPRAVVEGDIVVNRGLEMLMENSSGSGSGRSRRSLFPNGHIERWYYGVVPYIIDPKLNALALRAIEMAMKEFTDNTCIRFVQRKNQKDYVSFIEGNGCYSSIGRVGGAQELSIGEGCEFKDIVMHELMHTLGFLHEQSRLDRDRHVMVLWWNIQPNAMKNFATYSHGDLDRLNLEYDFESLMHYKNKDFTKNNDDTLQAWSQPSRPLGRVDGFSPRDIKMIGLFYNCAAKPYLVLLGAKKKETCRDLQSTCYFFRQNKALCRLQPRFALRQCKATCGFCQAHHDYS